MYLVDSKAQILYWKWVLCISVPVLLVVFGDFFVEVLWGVGDEAVFWQISSCMLRFTVVPHLSYTRTEEEKDTAVCQSPTGLLIHQARRKKNERLQNDKQPVKMVKFDFLGEPPSPPYNIRYFSFYLVYCVFVYKSKNHCGGKIYILDTSWVLITKC